MSTRQSILPMVHIGNGSYVNANDVIAIDRVFGSEPGCYVILRNRPGSLYSPWDATTVAFTLVGLDQDGEPAS